MNGATSGAMTGAATGAVAGSMVMPGVGTAVGAVVGGVAGWLGGSSQDAANESQQAWMKYNAARSRTVDMSELTADNMVAMYNADSTLQHAGIQTVLTNNDVRYNLDLIAETYKYNDLMFQQDLMTVFDQRDLDIALLHRRRLIERGDITARQASSGTVIGVGSNADVLRFSVSQEALEQVIIERNADKSAEKINNARAKSWWDAKVEFDKTEWQGRLQNFTFQENAKSAADSIEIEAYMRDAKAGYSSTNNYYAGLAGAQNAQTDYNMQQDQNLVNGMFSAASMGAQGYARLHPPTATPAATTSAGGVH